MELGKRFDLGNGGDIILVTGPAGAGKSSFIKCLIRYAVSLSIPFRVINDAEEIFASVALAEQKGEGGFYRKTPPDEGVVITGQAIVTRAYRDFFATVAREEYTGHPVIVEWAGGKKKEKVPGDSDFSYETIGNNIFFGEGHAEKIIPRLRAVVNLTTTAEQREERNRLRTGEEARSQTVSDLLHINDFPIIEGRFPKGKVFSIDNPLRPFGFRYGRLDEETSEFLFGLLNPFTSLAAEARLKKPRTDLCDQKEEEFFKDYRLLRLEHETLRTAQKLAAQGVDINEIRKRTSWRQGWQLHNIKPDETIQDEVQEELSGQPQATTPPSIDSTFTLSGEKSTHGLPPGHAAGTKHTYRKGRIK